MKKGTHTEEQIIGVPKEGRGRLHDETGPPIGISHGRPQLRALGRTDHPGRQKRLEGCSTADSQRAPQRIESTVCSEQLAVRAKKEATGETGAERLLTEPGQSGVGDRFRDRRIGGWTLRILTVVASFTRECPAGCPVAG